MSNYSLGKKGFNDYKIINNIAEIYCFRRNGEVVTFLVDAEDIPKLVKLSYRWCATYDKITKNFYGHTSLYYNDKNGKRKAERITLHEIIMGAKHIDHIDNNTKNNTKDNLRKTLYTTNATNRKSRNINNQSGYRNVSKQGKWWAIQLQIEGKNTILKKFPLDRLKEAGDYAEKMREKYYGEYAGKS